MVTARVRVAAEQIMAWLVHLWAACLWTAVSVQSLKSLYPSLGEEQSLKCTCREGPCQTAYWCRMQGKEQVQFLFSYNTVGKPTYSPGVSQASYIGSVQLSSQNAYSLKILKVKKEDAGLYFCIFPNTRTYYLLSPVARLQPGETSPTPYRTIITTTAAKKKAKASPSCPCLGKKKTLPVKGCSFPVLWSLVGTLMGQALLLLATVLYFSRLPKKCHHHFDKK